MNKGMPIWERHIEKIVLALTVVVLLVVFAMLVLGSNSITADIDGRQYGPAEVDAVLVEKAQDLGRKLGPDAEVDVSAFESIQAGGAGDFQDRLDARVGPVGSVPRLGPALAASLLPEGVESFDGYWYEPRFPAPVIRDRVAQAIDTIAPDEFTRVPELSSQLAGDPDVAWTTPVATLDLTAIRAELAASSPNADPPRKQIPDNWYNKRPYIVDVVFERQARDRDGSWSDAEVVDPIPGGIGLRAILAERRAEDRLDSNFKEELWLNLSDRVKQLEVLQPDFFATLNNYSASELMEEPEEEVDESEDGFVDDEDAARRKQERELRRRIRDRRNAASRLEATLDDLGGPMEESDLEDEDKPGDSGSGGRGSGRGGGDFVDPGGGGGGAGIGGSGQGRKSGGSMANQADQRKRIGMTKRLRSMEADIERLERQLANLNPEAVVEDTSAQTVEIPDIATEEQLLVWSHDIGVEPGSTYRYRCRILLYNPFFARGRQLLEEQMDLEDSFEVASAVSGWSKPVTVAPPVEFFVIRANDRDGSMGLGEARVELYRYENGARRSQQFSVQPGERIGRSVVVGGETVDFETDWYLVDVISDPSAGGSGLDQEDDATVVCRRLDGTEMRIRVPSRQRIDSQRTRLKVDADGATG